MKKGSIYEGKVEKIEFPNKGIIYYNEEKQDATFEKVRVIVKNSIPGQTVRFQVNKKRKNKCEARLLEVLEPSLLEDRQELCQHSKVCGGCSYQKISYQNQLELKENMVKSILNEVIKDILIEPIIKSPIEWEYRNKMEFSFGDEYKDGPLALGLHKKGSFYDVVHLDKCHIVDEDFNIIRNYVYKILKIKDLNFYHKMNHKGYLRHLIIRKGKNTNEILINIVTSSDISYDDEGLMNELSGGILRQNLSGKVKCILHTVNDSLSDVVKCDKSRLLFGKEFIYEELLGLKFKISPFSFFQTNSLGAEVLYKKVREYVGETKDKVVFDLYSGTGTIAQLVAPVAKKVVGVEIIEEAVEAAKENALLNNLNNCEFIAGDVLKVIDEIKEKPDIIILDPPRDGIHPKAIQKIIDFEVDKIVYISCKPTSLARDLEIFIEAGYKVEKAVPVDMFPGTVHVETVVLMSRAEK